jgi:hypothetical protein
MSSSLEPFIRLFSFSFLFVRPQKRQRRYAYVNMHVRPASSTTEEEEEEEEVRAMQARFQIIFILMQKKGRDSLVLGTQTNSRL